MLMAGGLALFAAAVCLGYGLAALRLAERLRPGLSSGVTVGDVGLLGYAAAGVLATLLNVVVPLSAVPAGLPPTSGSWPSSPRSAWPSGSSPPRWCGTA